MSTIDDSLIQASKLPLDEQARLRAAFAKALVAQPAGAVPVWQLVLRESHIGPNAFALPAGTLVMTDEMVTLVGADDKVITAAFAHELSHVRYRHGLRILVQATVMTWVSSVLVGDSARCWQGCSCCRAKPAIHLMLRKKPMQKRYVLFKSGGYIARHDGDAV